ncbi:MAG: helix-turn-helix transcriptional regulator [Bacteroidetes bacterium]|nr:helix-turn-helix transcriptional regulator [Bacteroidota bacterium]
MKAAQPRSTCPISFMLDIFGDRWTLLVMRDLLLNGKRSFSEFLASDEGVATNILTDRLEMLVDRGVIVKDVSPDNKSKFLYYPTARGVDLIPVLCEITLWAEKYSPAGASKAFTGPLKKQRQQTIAKLKKKFG